ncbi:MAG: LysR family transcriptional regulator [Gammaproteobacteria bacterium]
MRLRHIEIFHAIYTTGSITNAAKFLNVSQPSVSKVLSHAELQLGFQLFARIKGRLIPTPEADMLFNEADRIFNQMNTINELADNILNQHTGKLSVGITPALGFDVIPSVVNTFQQTHPDVKVEIQTLHNHHILNHILRQESDLAIMFSPNEIPDTKRYHFGDASMVCVLPNHPDYPDEQTLDLQQLSNMPYISIRKSGPLGDLLSRKVEVNKVKFASLIQVDTYYIALQMVKKGLGWCVIDEFTAKANQNESIRLHRLVDQIAFPVVGMTSSLQPLSNLTKAFIAEVKNQISF